METLFKSLITYPLSLARHNQHIYMHTLRCCSTPPPPSAPPQLQAHTFIIHRNQISEVVEESCFPLPLLLSYPSLILSTSVPSSPLFTSPLPGGKKLLLLQQTLHGAFWLSAASASHRRRQSGKQAPKQPGSPPRPENEQFSHCNNVPLSSSHYRHDKR